MICLKLIGKIVLLYSQISFWLISKKHKSTSKIVFSAVAQRRATAIPAAGFDKGQPVGAPE